MFTQQEKQIVIARFRALAEQRISLLQHESEKIAQTCERRILRRLNTVSVTLRDVKLKDVLEVERKHTPTIKGLLGDIRVEKKRTMRK